MESELNHAIPQVGGGNNAGRYLSTEQTESHPLKQALHSDYLLPPRKCCGDNEFGSPKVVISCFITLALLVTIALTAQIHYGDYELVPHGSVATDSKDCSLMGTNILKLGGNAVDAAVTSTLCMGVVNPHITGLGGGGFLMVYDHRRKKVIDVIDFRESAPQNADWSSLRDANVKKGLLVGIPGLIRGLAEAHLLHGKLPWQEILNPVIELARSGFHIPKSLISALYHLQDGEILDFYKGFSAGEYVTSPKLAAALELIAIQGPDVFYNGSLSQQILHSVEEAGGKMTAGDLNEYEPVHRKALVFQFGSYEIIVPEFPSGGPQLLASLTYLQNLKIVNNSNTIFNLVKELNAIQFSITNAWEHAEEFKMKNFHPDINVNRDIWNISEPVSSHVAAVDLNDLYVTIVSGLNTWFGSQLKTGADFLLNNAMISINNSQAVSGKRPLSMGVPVIAVEKNQTCGRRLILGGGDSLIVTQILTKLLAFNGDIISSVESARIHFGPTSKDIYTEDQSTNQFNEIILNELRTAGYNFHKFSGFSGPYLSCNVVEKIGDSLNSHSDSRGGGVSSRF